MRKTLAAVSLLCLAASPALAEDVAAAAVPIAAPEAAPQAAPAAAPVPAPAAANPPRPPLTLSRVGRHVTRTITNLMQRLAESAIPPQPRSALNERLLAVQAETDAAVQAGRPPEGEDVERFSARLGRELDAIAGAIDSASRAQAGR